jgi:hypothetical protein
MPWPVLNWLWEDDRTWWDGIERRDVTTINQLDARSIDSFGWTGRRAITRFRVDWRPRVTFYRDDRG